MVVDEVLDCFENVAAAKGTNAKKVLLKEYGLLTMYETS